MGMAVAEPKTREQVLEDALRDLIRNFRQTVASGRSRIVEEAGGDESACDSVEQMLAGNPYLRNAEKALAYDVKASGEASAWWALVMGAAASIEDAANCLRDPDAKRQADGAAKHYREAAQKLMAARGVKGMEPGYRALTAEDRIQLGDEYCGDDGKWTPIRGIAVGMLYGSASFHPCRRPVGVMGSDVPLEQRPDYCAGFVAGQRYAESHLGVMGVDRG